MKLRIEFLQRTGDAVSFSAIHRLVRKTMQAFFDKKKQYNISIVVTNAREVSRLNWHYRLVKGDTDVLSFGFYETVLGKETVQMGELVISYAKLSEQAQNFGHSLEMELKILVLHGLLHLLGYDHETDEQMSQMRQLEEQLLKKKSQGLTVRTK